MQRLLKCGGYNTTVREPRIETSNYVIPVSKRSPLNVGELNYNASGKFSLAEADT
jgi:hypothetical protein